MSDRLDRMSMERNAATVAAQPTAGKLAFDGDGDPFDDSPVYCPVCQEFMPFDQAHAVLWDGTIGRVVCQTAGNEITYPEYTRRLEKTKA